MQDDYDEDEFEEEVPPTTPAKPAAASSDSQDGSGSVFRTEWPRSVELAQRTSPPKRSGMEVYIRVVLRCCEGQ